MKHPRSFKLESLYHRFLKPKDIDISDLPRFVSMMYAAGFIDLYHDNEDPDVERYVELEKLTSREHRDELFKLIQSLKG